MIYGVTVISLLCVDEISLNSRTVFDYICVEKSDIVDNNLTRKHPEPTIIYLSNYNNM